MNIRTCIESMTSFFKNTEELWKLWGKYMNTHWTLLTICLIQMQTKMNDIFKVHFHWFILCVVDVDHKAVSE